MVMATGSGAREENGEFCVTVSPMTRTVGILSWLKALVAN